MQFYPSSPKILNISFWDVLSAFYVVSVLLAMPLNFLLKEVMLHVHLLLKSVSIFKSSNNEHISEIQFTYIYVKNLLS